MKQSKDEIWNFYKKAFDKHTDKKGMKLDKPIKPVVIALNAMGFATVGSCRGHENWGRAYPWVMIQPEGYDEKDVEKSKNLGLKERRQLLKLLNEFYKVSAGTETKLTIATLYGGIYELQNMGAELVELHPRKERTLKRKQFVAEMDRFADFLKKKFYS